MEHKGFTIDLEVTEIAFSFFQVTATTRNGSKVFEFECQELNDSDFRDGVIDDSSILSYDTTEILQWATLDLKKGFYKDIIEKDCDNIQEYVITTGNTIKLFFKNELVAVGENDIEDYIAYIGRF